MHPKTIFVRRAELFLQAEAGRKANVILKFDPENNPVRPENGGSSAISAKVGLYPIGEQIET